MIGRLFAPVRPCLVPEARRTGLSYPCSGDHPHKACGSKIEAIHESLDEADRVVRPHVIVNRFRQKQQLRAICS